MCKPGSLVPTLPPSPHYTNCKYAARSQLIERSTVSCMLIDGSRALAVSANSKCREQFTETGRRFGVHCGYFSGRPWNNHLDVSASNWYYSRVFEHEKYSCVVKGDMITL